VQSLTSVDMALGWKKWQSAWTLRDPKDAHWHIGPFAVEPEYQRQGVGLALLQATCEHIDNYPAIAYVETDVPGTVKFFELSGFREVAEAAVMGLPNWFMVRPRQR
jgi:predicted N-acetyltransferase YhbS